MNAGLYAGVIGLWALFALYWVAKARDVKDARREEALGSKLRYSLPGSVALPILMLPPQAGWLLDAPILPGTTLPVVTGVTLILAGLSFAVWARRVLGRNWSVFVTVKENHELVRSGPYNLARHPIYSGILLAILGTALTFNHWRGLIAVVIMAVSFRIKSRIEERAMIETFGDRYRAYEAEVAALVPFIW